jgi:RNA polymerase sigma-70 factor (ECF subfamily)
MSFLWPSYDDRLRELCARARAGDRDAFRALYAELYGPVAKFVARRVGRREDAEDLVAKIFHKLLERLPDIDSDRGSVRMFVIAMARNAVIDHVRTRRGDVPIDDAQALLADEAGTPLDALLREEDLRDLRAVLLELPDDTREMLALRYGDGLRHGEIAEMYGINVAAVKQRFSRALRALRERLARGGIEGEERAASPEGAEGDEQSSKGSVANVRV